MAVDPMQIVFKLLEKGKDIWTKRDKENYELCFNVLLSVDEQERITIWQGETPDIYLAKN